MVVCSVGREEDERVIIIIIYSVKIMIIIQLFFSLCVRIE